MKTTIQSIEPQNTASAVAALVLLSTVSLQPSSAIAQGNASSPGVVKSVNGLAGQLSLSAGPGITIRTAGNRLTISAQSGPPPNAWRTSGNQAAPGDFLGTLNAAPLELKAGGLRALRLELGGVSDQYSDGTPSGAPNVIGGSPFNFVRFGVVGAFIGGGGATNYSNFDSSGSGSGVPLTNNVGADFGVVVGGLRNTIQEYAFASTIGGGELNTVQSSSFHSTLAGGFGNVIHSGANYCTVGGGCSNAIEDEPLRETPYQSTIAGGAANTISSYLSTIGGGGRNAIRAAAYQSTIGGGARNTIESGANGSTIGGGEFNSIQAGTLTEGDATISGGYRNTVSSGTSCIGGGAQNAILFAAEGSVIGGGGGNTIGSEDSSTLGFTTASVIGGGFQNNILDGAYSSTIGGGAGNTNAAPSATIAGGTVNLIKAGAEFATIGGGNNNTVQASAWGAAIPGGVANAAAGTYSFAAGRAARANHDGAFVWADSSGIPFASANHNEFAVRATGGTRFVSFIDAAGNPVAGVQLPAGGGSWATLSDRNAKTGLETIDATAVLEKVTHLAMTTWSYKAQVGSIRHIGPMAQDFHAAFQVGEDDKHIATVDADGVALAAIQGLNQKLEQAMKEKDERIATLEQSLAELKTLVNQLPVKQAERNQ